MYYKPVKKVVITTQPVATKAVANGQPSPKVVSINTDAVVMAEN
jgi:hypothetical protein